MILPQYRIAASPIAGAGKGLFLAEPVARGRIVVAPDAIPRTYGFDEIEAAPNRDEILPSAVRWFEDRYTVTPDWPDECFVNHSFEPTGLWHLGFIFAAIDLEIGDELTVDYRHLLGEGQEESFRDTRTGGRIVGFAWVDSLQRSTDALRRLLAE
ncbi:MAG TPA: SET domain-containing protein [Candidatus Saccharimonadia bacterium]|nr:SET domain-containing protein [Candidatus Saccharimonadia bacterium]